MRLEDIWAPGILDEEREHRNRWAEGRRHESHYYSDPPDPMFDEESDEYDIPAGKLAGSSDDCPF